MEKMSKKLWTELFEEVGLDRATMRRWHAAFERRVPDDHQRFLEWLGISSDEIDEIRAQSRA